MRNPTHLLALLCLLTLPATATAQRPDPFGGGTGGIGADPFGDKPKPDTVRPKVVATKPTQVAEKALTARPSEVTQRLRAALDEETSQSFVELPLRDAVRQLSETHDIPIVVNSRALEEIGLSAQEPVTLSLHGVSLRSFLRLLLRDLDLTYIIKDEVMQITTIEAAEGNLVVEMYRFAPELTEKADKIVKALTASVVPDAWDVQGGPCTVTPIDNVLVISATETIHEQVIEFMQKLEKAFERHKAKS